MTAATGMPRKPMSTQRNHWERESGVVLAKAPRNWTMMNWKMAVKERTPTKT